MTTNNTTEGKTMTLQLRCMKNGITKTLTAKPETTLADLEEYQEHRITFPGYESISILMNGEIYSTLEN